MRALNSIRGLVVGAAAALGSTACCLGPLLFLSLGLGGSWLSSLRALEPLEPVFIVVALASVGFSFWRLYIKPRACASGQACDSGLSLKAQRRIFWLVSVFILGMLTSSWWGVFLLDG